MKKSIDLSIANPCKENYKDFKSAPLGGFCSSCEKEVVDFSKMSEEMIKNYFLQENANTCGRFRSDQLKSYPLPALEIGSKNNLWVKTAFGISIVGLLGTNNLGAAPQPNERLSIIRSLEIDSRPANKPATAQPDSLQSGTVVDIETKEAIPFVNVYLKGSNFGVTSDFDGQFTFPKKLHVGDTLIFQFIGYRKMELIIGSSHIDIDLNISLHPVDIIIMGEVQVNTPFRSKSSFWERLKNRF